jgi:cytochrome bd-type quinol oxidase subunit 1
MYLWKGEPVYETAARFWTSLFAVSFALWLPSTPGCEPVFKSE